MKMFMFEFVSVWIIGDVCVFKVCFLNVVEDDVLVCVEMIFGVIKKFDVSENVLSDLLGVWLMLLMWFLCVNNVLKLDVLVVLG